MKLFGDVTERANALFSKFQQAITDRVAELRSQGRSEQQIKQIVETEINTFQGFAKDFDDQIQQIAADATGKKPTRPDEIPTKVATERARLLRLKAAEFSIYIPQVSTVNAAIKHVHKISYWSQAAILLYRESDDREPNPDLRFEFYDGLFDQYTDALLRAHCYRATIWACTEFESNKIYTQRSRRTNFSQRIATRLSTAHSKLESRSKPNDEVVPGWFEDAKELVANMAHKADLIEWDAIHEVDECQDYLWQLGPEFEHCPDCTTRAGQIKTYEEWFELGVPGFAKTACGDRCSCELKKTKELRL